MDVVYLLSISWIQMHHPHSDQSQIVRSPSLVTDGDPLLKRVLATAFPDQSPTVIRDYSSRSPNSVYAVHIADTDYFVKFDREIDSARRLCREVAALEYAHTHTTLAPNVVTAAPNGSTGDEIHIDGAQTAANDAIPAYLVTQSLDGTPLADSWGSLPADTSSSVFRQIGVALGQLHTATQQETCGRIIGGRNGMLTLSPQGSWHLTLCDLTRHRVNDLAGSRFETIAAEVLACVGRHCESIETGVQPALLHNDPGPFNVIVRDGGITGLIDWEFALCGDAVFDLCRVENALRDGPATVDDEVAARDALYAGYRTQMVLGDGFEARRAVYRVVQRLRSLRTFESWGPRVTDDIPTLARTLRERVRTDISAVEDTARRD